MESAFSRLEAVLGYEKTNVLARSKIAVFGLGGVGSFVTEALARSGVGSLTLVDFGLIAENEISSHLYALHSSIGRSKAALARERIKDIDEDILVHIYETGYGSDTAGLFDLAACDYVVDAMGDVASKVQLISRARKEGARIISCTVLENLQDPSKLAVVDLFRIGAWPSAKILREELKKQGVRNVKILASQEKPKASESIQEADRKSVRTAGSICSVKGMAGMLIASEVIRDLTSPKAESRKK